MSHILFLSIVLLVKVGVVTSDVVCSSLDAEMLPFSYSYSVFSRQSALIEPRQYYIEWKYYVFCLLFHP